MSIFSDLLALFSDERETAPEGRYALEFRGHYYTGRAHNGEPILSPDPACACAMTMEQAAFKRRTERYFGEFQIVPMAREACRG